MPTMFTMGIGDVVLSGNVVTATLSATNSFRKHSKVQPQTSFALSGFQSTFAFLNGQTVVLSTVTGYGGSPITAASTAWTVTFPFTHANASGADNGTAVMSNSVPAPTANPNDPAQFRDWVRQDMAWKESQALPVSDGGKGVSN